MARVLAQKSVNRAFVLILMIALIGWSTTGFGQAVEPSGLSLQGAFNVTIKFDDPGLEGCVAPTMNTADGGVMAAACTLAESPGYGEIYVAGLSGGRITGQPLPIGATDVGGYQWSRDSKRIYFRQGPSRLMSSAIESAPTLRASAPVQAFDFKALRLDPTEWDILPDGRLIGLQLGAGEGDLQSYSVVLNWVDSVKARLAKK